MRKMLVTKETATDVNISEQFLSYYGPRKIDEITTFDGAKLLKSNMCVHKIYHCLTSSYSV